MKRLFLYTLLVVVSTLTCHLSVMGETVDSLYTNYQNSPDSKKLAAANEFFKALNDVEFTDSLIQFSKSTKANYIDSHVHYWMAEYYYGDQLFEPSLEAAKRAVIHLNDVDDNRFKSDAMGVLGNAYFRLGIYDQALQTMMAVYQLDKQIGDDDLISSDLNTFAAIYLAVNQPESGIPCIEKAIELERKLKRPGRLAIRLGLASELYTMNKEYDKAMAAIQEAYEIDQRDGRTDKAAIRQVQMGNILEKMSRLDEARRIMLRALPILENAGNSYSLAVCYNQLGSIEKKVGNLDAAIEYYKKALDQSIKCGAPKNERTAEYGLYETMRDNNPAVALLHLERYAALSDSLLNRTTVAQLNTMEASNEAHELTQQFEAIQTSNKWMMWGGILLALCLVATLAGLYQVWRKNKSALRLQQQTQNMRDHLFSNITNELRTPLTVIMNAGQQLINGHKTSIEENKRTGELVMTHGKNMLRLVNQMFDIKKVQSEDEKPDLRSGDIVMFVRMAVENFSNIAQQQLVGLNFDCPMNSLIVAFTPNYLRKILHNLISNAIKFTPRNGSVKVTLNQLSDNMMRLAIADTGRGIPVEERNSMFEPFMQGKNRDDDSVETGIDLSLVNQLVKLMGGTIQVESELGKGTTFTIDFPVEYNEDAQHLEQAVPIDMPFTAGNDMEQKPMVFIVEDHDDVSFFIASLLRQDYNLRFARDGREAFQNAQGLVPDLIITDTLMPVMDGKELIKSIRADATLDHIPIIAMTFDISDQERIECIEAGADAVIIKPFNTIELKLLVKHLISQRSNLRQRYVKSSDAMATDSPAPQLSKDDNEFINKLVDVIYAQMSKDDINMEHIAAALSMSRKQLRTRVMALTGLTPVAYVLQVRLNYARKMMTNEDISLTTIASKCGFQNLSHFSKAFKQQFNVTPSQFRRKIDDIHLPPPRN